MKPRTIAQNLFWWLVWLYVAYSLSYQFLKCACENFEPLP